MIGFPTAALENAGQHLLNEIQAWTTAHGADNTPPFHEKLDRQAKTVSTVTKAFGDLLTLNDTLAERNDKISYTRLEDLPPLHPDDEARIKAEFYHLAHRVSGSRCRR
jgi:hypothetical protein